MDSHLTSRRRWLFLTGSLVGWAGSTSVLANSTFEDPRRDFDDLYTENVETAIQKGLAFLQSRVLDEGGFITPGWGQNAAVCGLIGLCLLGRGIRPGMGDLGRMLENTGQLILRCCQDSGYIESLGKSSHGPMYEHGFATLFLAEYYGTGQNESIRDPLSRAIQVILRSQNPMGGWRYEPAPIDADLSVTVCQIMALRAARNAGMAVPKETIERAVDYVKRSQNSDGGFMYQLTGGESRPPLTAAAVVALYNSGIDLGKEIDEAIAYLEANFSSIQSLQRNAYFFYAHYYSVQAFWHRGGEAWKAWYRRLRDILLAMQDRDGNWFDNNSSEYGTAMACIILNMPRTVLPIFQR